MLTLPADGVACALHLTGGMSNDCGDPRPPVIDRYALLELLGEGGIGCVYRAKNIYLGHEVALKILRPSFVDDEIVLERFWREAKTASSTKHEHLVSLLDFGVTAEEVHFLVMEYVPGETLSQLLKREHRIEPVRLAKIARQIALGLEHMHELGLIHRDLKPANVMLSGAEEPHVKLLDFGIVAYTRELKSPDRFTRPGLLIGTPSYMAPEQISGDSGDGRIDLYALGVVLYQALGGVLPFVGPASQVLAGHLAVPPKPLQGAGPLGDLALWLMEKDPQQRPASAREVIAVLDTFLELGRLTREEPLDRWFEDEAGDFEIIIEPEEEFEKIARAEVFEGMNWRRTLLILAASIGCLAGVSFASGTIHFQSPIVIEGAKRARPRQSAEKQRFELADRRVAGW